MGTDTMGRVFVGWRDAVFVYEPTKDGLADEPVELHRFGPDRWALGLAIRGHDLYVALHDELWLLEGAVIKRADIVAKRILWNLPRAKSWAVHQGLHDLKWGPTGKLYIALGDQGWFFGDFDRPDHWLAYNLKTAGTPADVPLTIGGGGILRCDPDGSNLELVAHGTRNNNGIAFDADWNLFTSDNDHERLDRYIPSRILHIVPGGFYNWPRGWLEDDRPEQLPSVGTTGGRDAPVGLAYYDHDALGEDFAGSLLLCRWAQHKLSRHKLKPQGASFTADEFPLLETKGDARPMAVTITRDGRIYAVIVYMARNEASPVYKADIVEFTNKHNPNTHKYAPYDAVEADQNKLFSETLSINLHRRMPAHVEVIRRGEEMWERPVRKIRDPLLPYRELRHAIHLLAIIRDESTIEDLQRLATHEDERVRYQALLTAAEWPDALDHAFLVKRLEDPSPSVRRATLAALRASKQPFDEKILGEIVLQAMDADPFIRQPAAMLAAAHATPEVFYALYEQVRPAMPRAAVLIAGCRISIPPAADPLPNTLQLTASIHEAVSEGEAPKFGLFTIDQWHAAMKPAQPWQTPLIEMLTYGALEETEIQARLLALRYLVLLRNPDTVDALLTLATEANAEVRALAATGLLGMNLPDDRRTQLHEHLLLNEDTDGQVRVQTIAACQSAVLLRRVVLGDRFAPEVRAAAIERLHTLKDPGLAAVLAMIPKDVDVRILQAMDTAQGRAPRTETGEDATAAIDKHFAGADWNEIWKKGNRANGEKLYSRHNALGVSCATCHQRDGAGGDLGPNLDDAGERLKPDYIAESILHPSRHVVPEFKTFTLLMTGGQTRTGVILGEDASNWIIGKSDGTKETLIKAWFSWQTPEDTSIMPAGQVSTPQELLDLVAYLMSPSRKK